jgi:hypothetical protein
MDLLEPSEGFSPRQLGELPSLSRLKVQRPLKKHLVHRDLPGRNQLGRRWNGSWLKFPIMGCLTLP